MSAGSRIEPGHLGVWDEVAVVPEVEDGVGSVVVGDAALTGAVVSPKTDDRFRHDPPAAPAAAAVDEELFARDDRWEEEQCDDHRRDRPAPAAVGDCSDQPANRDSRA